MYAKFIKSGFSRQENCELNNFIPVNFQCPLFILHKPFKTFLLSLTYWFTATYTYSVLAYPVLQPKNI
jgi:hypothetical protein